jgi:hypothetical protein
MKVSETTAVSGGQWAELPITCHCQRFQTSRFDIRANDFIT